MVQQTKIKKQIISKIISVLILSLLKLFTETHLGRGGYDHQSNHYDMRRENDFQPYITA